MSPVKTKFHLAGFLQNMLISSARWEPFRYGIFFKIEKQKHSYYQQKEHAGRCLSGGGRSESPEKSPCYFNYRLQGPIQSNCHDEMGGPMLGLSRLGRIRFGGKQNISRRIASSKQCICHCRTASGWKPNSHITSINLQMCLVNIPINREKDSRTC